MSHPNLVTLVGACPEARAVVYEFVLGGILEDHVRGKPPLPWNTCFEVVYQTCFVLAFLHSTQSQPTVHGDMKTANILLDEQRSLSKLAVLGMRRLAE